MKRGEIWWADLEPVIGTEANKRRPVVVISNDTSNAVARQLGRGVVTVIPVTSNVSRVLSFQVLLRAGQGGLSQDSKAQAEQVRSIDLVRLISRVGMLQPSTMTAIEAALRRHLAL